MELDLSYHCYEESIENNISPLLKQVQIHSHVVL